MKAMFKKMAPLFEKGGKFEKYYPLFEAGESFMYSSAARTQGGAHVRDGIDLKRLMMTVIIALLPAIFMSLYNTGVQGLLSENVAMSDIGLVAAIARGAMVFLPIYIVTLAVGGILETVFAVVRKHEINEGFLVTSMLFPLIVPPTIPLWQVALGIAFGTVIGKEVFGGTGMNILNPALTGRLFLFFAYPGQISGDKVWLDTSVDGFTMATPLGNLQADGMSAVSDLSWMDAFIGFLPGSLGETSALACLIGALILIFTKVASWRIMLGSVFGLIGMSYLLKTFAPDAAHYMAVPWYWHLVLGGFAFGTVFMATDPVSAAQTDTGRWVYGIMIGVLTVLVRVLNPAYPEGMMMAIIFMNLFAPVIDYYVVKSNIKKREQRLGLQ
ncbi:MAG: NADH:ubiquinone reductase (Na(+)-transporting) subunit B [Planctomycetes bacterium]|jgi:Na+-transporting NADH:ubiquinone oxidoreductase subunit B|nr:NADH:ubiquinone reductase (Na(+)-transporting) subunit B [Planctomycetota bacterium]MBT4029466.1 NADH:ubiquinone reductase (Na(+)-transporting) subunit B [Planctomycetota bacterium]MBT4560664.1 NADH:ubiquinone reductase (Na(+)-transporting) subunit B [Planctomycetota bacterium]MBT5102406.1 NADH:ubiquinone reductase (Na(+)-transporting) subunit B [Planctomycetota bacterium]MBT5119940.1 NADH:ubiquinone reductase (Na(+)-transporting) subunit B [Planctomycetota bacterium]